MNYKIKSKIITASIVLPIWALILLFVHVSEDLKYGDSLQIFLFVCSFVVGLNVEIIYNRILDYYKPLKRIPPLDIVAFVALGLILTILEENEFLTKPTNK